MAYEYQRDANQVAQNLMDVLEILTDDVPDQQQVAALLAEATTIFAQVSKVVAAEEKQIFKGKFLAKVGLSVGSRSLDKYIPDEV